MSIENQNKKDNFPEGVAIVELKDHLDDPDDLMMVIDIVACSFLGARQKIADSINEQFIEGRTKRMLTNFTAGAVMAGYVVPKMSEVINSILLGTDISTEEPETIITRVLSMGVAVAAWQEFGYAKQRKVSQNIARDELESETMEAANSIWYSLDDKTQERILEEMSSQTRNPEY